MTLRRRLMVAFAYLLTLAIVALSVPLGFNVARRARTDFAVSLTNRAEQVATSILQARRAGPEAVDALVQAHPEIGRVIVVDADGTLLADSTGRRRLGRDYRAVEEELRQRGEPCCAITAALDGRTTRLVRTYPNTGTHYVVAVPIISDRRIVGAVRVNQRVVTVDAIARRRLLAMIGVSVAVLVVGLLVSAALARSLTRPLHRLATTAKRVGEGDLQVRADETGQREVAEVARALNVMSARIEQTLTAQRDFLANASHQLRTPLTGLRLRLEALSVSGASGADAALAEADRLNMLVDDLLTLVRAGVAPVRGERTDLDAAVTEAVDRWSMGAAETRHTLVLRPAAPPGAVAAGADDVAMVLDNLIENALKYSPPGSTVTVTTDREDGSGVIRVSNDGPGVADEDRERLFERFYRGHGGAAAPGTGLGLAIVAEVVSRWGGSVHLEPDLPTTFVVRFPAAPATGDDQDTAELDTTAALR